MSTWNRSYFDVKNAMFQVLEKKTFNASDVFVFLI
jgi:hypothetical protein